MIDTLPLKARSIARAIKASNGNRVSQETATTESARLMMECIEAKCSPQETAACLQIWMNLSANNQEWERHGLVKTDRAVPALISAVKAELAKK